MRCGSIPEMRLNTSGKTDNGAVMLDSKTLHCVLFGEDVPFWCWVCLKTLIMIECLDVQLFRKFLSDENVVFKVLMWFHNKVWRLARWLNE